MNTRTECGRWDVECGGSQQWKRLKRAIGSNVRRVSALFVIALISTSTASIDIEAHSKRQHSNKPVVDWNRVAHDAYLPTQGFIPLAQSRTFSILHAAIHDALNAIEARYELYTPGLVADPGASKDAAVAAASRDVLVALIPDQQALIETAYTNALGAIADSRAKEAGIAVGQASAAATLARRKFDGADSATEPIYVPKNIPGDYQFTPPFDFANLPGWGSVTPFGINLSEHRLDGPDPLQSARYAFDLNYVKAIGEKNSTKRTGEQSEIAQFWYEDSPLGWNRIAATAIQQARLDAHDAARVFALVHFAMADGFIAGFSEKYRLRFWRPITAIQQADRDDNRFTEQDAAWEPFLVTPPVPDYPSTHTVLGAAAAEVLIQVFGDKMRYDATSVTLPGVTRRYKGLSQAAIENGLSRIYAGIHFLRAVMDG